MAPRGAMAAAWGLVAVTTAVELVLAGADAGLWGTALWRARAYDLGALRPWLLIGEPPEFPGQPVTMFLSHALLHGGLLHLVGNMLGLLALVRALSGRLGAVGLVGLYAGSAVAGALAFALLARDAGQMVGASGAVFGLAGALAIARPGGLWRMMAELAVLNLALWVATSGLVAWQAHLGGFLAGLALAPLVLSRGGGRH